MLGRSICGGAFIAILRRRGFKSLTTNLKQLARQCERIEIPSLGTVFACWFPSAVTVGSPDLGRHTVSSRLVSTRFERASLGRGLDRPYRPDLDGTRAVPEH